MSTKFPAIFVSHGAPTLIIEDRSTRDFLWKLGKKIGRPEGIVTVSGHWTTTKPRVTINPYPTTLHDIGSFAKELYSVAYPAPGAPLLAERVLSQLKAKGIRGGKDNCKEYDHGTWGPLMLMYPEADIPVIQLSVQPNLGPEHHLILGQALAPLLEEGILLLASGSATHNLRDFLGRALDAPPLPYAKDFADWLKDAVSNDRLEELLDYQRCGPQAARNHPTPEHFLPIFVAMGAGGKGQLIHDGFTYGVLSMAAFLWE